MAEAVASGLIACDHQQEKEGLELQGRQVVRGCQNRYHVSFRSGLLLSGQSLRILEDLEGVGAAKWQQPVGIGVVLVVQDVREVGISVVHDRVGPVEQLLGVPVGNTEELADHLDREASSNSVDEVDLARLESLLDRLCDQSAGCALPLPDGTASEASRDQLSDPRVFGRIGFQHRPTGLARFGVPFQLLEFGAPNLRGERSMVTVDRHEVIEARHSPESRVPIRLVNPCDRGMGTHGPELFVGDPFCPEVIGQNLEVRHRRLSAGVDHSTTPGTDRQGTNRPGGWPVAELQHGDRLSPRQSTRG